MNPEPEAPEKKLMQFVAAVGSQGLVALPLWPSCMMSRCYIHCEDGPSCMKGLGCIHGHDPTYNSIV